MKDFLGNSFSAGDLVVYSTKDETSLQVGRVKSCEGRIIIETKWGRTIHRSPYEVIVYQGIEP
jgi:hypothetical protein